MATATAGFTVRACPPIMRAAIAAAAPSRPPTTRTAPAGSLCSRMASPGVVCAPCAAFSRWGRRPTRARRARAPGHWPRGSTRRHRFVRGHPCTRGPHRGACCGDPAGSQRPPRSDTLRRATRPHLDGCGLGGMLPPCIQGVTAVQPDVRAARRPSLELDRWACSSRRSEISSRENRCTTFRYRVEAATVASRLERRPQSLDVAVRRHGSLCLTGSVPERGISHRKVSSGA
jgi:hypothetical protein